MDENKIYWVRGNTQELLIPLEQEIVPEEGEIQVEPYYPAEGATVTVCLVGKYKKHLYAYCRWKPLEVHRKRHYSSGNLWRRGACKQP